MLTASVLLLLSPFIPADPRNPMRAMDPIRLDSSLHPKPALPERPIGPLPPKPPIVVKPLFPPPAASAGVGARPFSAPPCSSSAERVHLRTHTHDSRPGETTAQVIQHSENSFIAARKVIQI